MEINQGDIFWLQNDKFMHKEAYPHPVLVIQENVFNYSSVSTIIVCGLTTNLKKISIPGNVFLEQGEANLSKSSIVEVAKITSVEKKYFHEYIGSVSQIRIEQILSGLNFLQKSYFSRENKTAK